MNWKKYRVDKEQDINLSHFDTHPGKHHTDKKDIDETLQNDVQEISKFQYKLYAENRQALLIILQGMDSSGKDGTIRHIMSGVNPQGVGVFSFKHPSTEELEHDFLWRHVLKLPERGHIVIFNRSHYENVLIAKVHPEIVLAERIPNIDTVEKVDKSFWKRRYNQINDFEKNIITNGTQILKFFLHLSKDEQRSRFLARIDDKEKHWKFSSADITERGFWKDYTHAYEQAIVHTSTAHAPWYIVPADDKPYAHLLIGRIILEKLNEMKPAYPPVAKEEEKLMAQAKKELEKE